MVVIRSVKHCLNKNNVELVQLEVGISFTDTDVDHNLEPITSAEYVEECVLSIEYTVDNRCEIYNDAFLRSLSMFFLRLQCTYCNF